MLTTYILQSWNLGSLVSKSSVLTQLPAIALMPELLDEVIQSVRKVKQIITVCLIYVPKLWVFDIALQQKGWLLGTWKRRGKVLLSSHSFDDFVLLSVLAFPLLFSLVFCSELGEVLRLVLLCFCQNVSCLLWQIGENVVFVLLQNAKNQAQTLRTISPMLWDEKQTCRNFRGTFFLYMLQGELCI